MMENKGILVDLASEVSTCIFSTYFLYPLKMKEKFEIDSKISVDLLNELQVIEVPLFLFKFILKQD